MTGDPVAFETVKLQRKSRSVPKVSVYSRHRKTCRHFGNHTRTGCDCPKQLSYFRDGKVHRISADTCDSDVADKKARELMNVFEAAAKGEPTPILAGTTSSLLEDAVNTFLTSKQQTDVTEKHVAKLRFELGAFSTFALGKGLVNLGDIKTEHVLQFRNSLVGAQNTRAKKIFRLIGFFKFCVEMGWIQRNPAQVSSVKLKYDDAQVPKALTDEQFETLLAAVQKVNGKTTDEQRRKLRSMALLMRWTGLAIRDAVTIERARFQQNGDGMWKLQIQRAKTGHAVYAKIQPHVMEQVLAGANAKGRYLFIDAVPEAEKELDNMVGRWGTLFSKLGDAAELKDENGEPYGFGSHSMRHTFVAWALNKGLPTEDVAMLIGDSVQIVAKHYSAWIAGRQEKLDERMTAALAASAR